MRAIFRKNKEKATVGLAVSGLLYLVVTGESDTVNA